jgi:hypothetical protein
MYKLTPKNSENIQSTVQRTSDGACIPFDPANTDYQAFLLWKAQGNTPTPEDEGTQ